CGSERGILFIQIIPSSASLTEGAPTVQFIANGVFERGPDENITNRVTWASAQPDIVTISSAGLATHTVGEQCGSATITASLDGVTDTAVVTVSGGPPFCL
ncbi:MAG: Ig-like domain-containing protein, partial [Candidatus Acidiferrales bacterium]